MATPIFIGGTSSHAGKSWMTTALCAWLHRQGVRVAPFKAQNMSNNAYPCPAGGEIGRAQVAQAWACGLEPEPAMNPILLKPNSERGSQVIVNGQLWKTLSARDYYRHHAELFPIVVAAYHDLASRFDVIVVEGAGSVSELNLRAHDLANLKLVTHLSAPWLLVGDIERGGIFASILGTIQLLTSQERSLLRAFAVNKFRGDLSLFDEGRAILESKSGCPCLGVLPFAPDIDLDHEDSLSIPTRSQYAPSHCAILRLPRISNTTDFRLLENPAWITAPLEHQFNFIFLPGGKNTIDDLRWLRRQGLDHWLQQQHRRGATLIGICGGLQMLGESIDDPHGMETNEGSAPGLGFLPLRTTLTQRKITRAVAATSAQNRRFSAYEIHLGESNYAQHPRRPFATLDDGSLDGILADRVIGTYLHGAFEDPAILAEFGIPATKTPPSTYHQLADWFAPFSGRFLELFPELQPLIR